MGSCLKLPQASVPVTPTTNGEQAEGGQAGYSSQEGLAQQVHVLARILATLSLDNGFRDNGGRADMGLQRLQGCARSRSHVSTGAPCQPTLECFLYMTPLPPLVVP